ncbi:hypothetical protein [Kiloniella sp. b19]|uniref:hypothetical protein n=1 Tax=Kiloniella sp. GXU_MW_B19 TaxID=3141326 RepID=UPI0031DD3C54
MLAILQTRPFSFSYLLCLFAVLLTTTACVTQEPKQYNLQTAFETAPTDNAQQRFHSVQVNPEDAGLLHLFRKDLFTAGAVLSAVLIDGRPVMEMTSGKATFPVRAGSYFIEIRYGLPCDSWFSQGDCATNPYPNQGHSAQLTVEAGEEVFLEIRFLDPANGFAFIQEQQDNFQSTSSQESVKKLVALIEPEQPSPRQNTAGAPARQTPSGFDEKQATTERDTLVLLISDRIKNGQYGAAIPLFEKLDRLPVPLDPRTGFYWGQTLIEAGQTEAGLIKLRRYVKSLNTNSAYYQPTLRLIARAEGS